MKKEELMKRFIPVLSVVIFVIIFLSGNICPSYAQDKETQSLKKVCCFAGTYKGFRKDLPSKSCSEPTSGEFKIEIKQDKGCGSKIWGIISDPTGSPMKFKGKVTAGPGRCCTLEAKAEKPGESVKFKGVLCKRGTKWYCKEGKYVNSRGCSGVFELEQI
jgi:hypothetical protein